jgi:non-specific serine/threonine protein kinase
LLYQKEHGTQPGPVSEKVRRLDGKEDKRAPKYLHVAQNLALFTQFADELKVKLSDLGGGESSPPLVGFLLCYCKSPRVILI